MRLFQHFRDLIKFLKDSQIYSKKTLEDQTFEGARRQVRGLKKSQTFL